MPPAGAWVARLPTGGDALTHLHLHSLEPGKQGYHDILRCILGLFAYSLWFSQDSLHAPTITNAIPIASATHSAHSRRTSLNRPTRLKRSFHRHQVSRR